MNLTQIKCLSVFAVFAIIGFGPISPGCLIGMFIVLKRPRWFARLISNLYINLATPIPDEPADNCKPARIKCFLSLLLLFTIDILPVPVTPTIAFCIILLRPMAFYRIVVGVYGGESK